MKNPRFDPAEPTGQKGSLSLTLSQESKTIKHTRRGKYCAQQLHERGQAMKLRSQLIPCEGVDFLTDIWKNSINV